MKIKSVAAGGTPICAQRAASGLFFQERYNLLTMLPKSVMVNDAPVVTLEATKHLIKKTMTLDEGHGICSTIQAYTTCTVKEDDVNTVL